MKQYGSGDATDTEHSSSSHGPEALEQATSAQANNDHGLRGSMQTIVNQFMQEERNQP